MYAQFKHTSVIRYGVWGLLGIIRMVRLAMLVDELCTLGGAPLTLEFGGRVEGGEGARLGAHRAKHGGVGGDEDVGWGVASEGEDGRRGRHHDGRVWGDVWLGIAGHGGTAGEGRCGLGDALHLPAGEDDGGWGQGGQLR